jgi:hypothetical protein
VHPDLDHVHHEVGPIERPPPVEMFLEVRIGSELLRSPAGHHARGFEALRIYVVQQNLDPVKLGEAEYVGEQVLGEYDAAGSDKGYFGDLGPP